VRRDSKDVPLQAELVENIEDLHSKVRQRAATALVKMFEQRAKEAIKDGTLKLPAGQTWDSFGRRLGLTVEYSLYMNYWGHGSEPNPPYSERMRMILHNVKTNDELRDKLLGGTLTPHALTQLSSHEMARKELQEETAQIIKENDKQHLLIQESGPRIRRTHKGEELIIDETEPQQSTSEAPQNSSVSRRTDTEGEREVSPERMSPQSPSRVELPDDIVKSPSKPLKIDTQTRAKRHPERKQSSTFNMDSVWSSVDSPSMARPIPVPNTPITTGPGAKADPEIDKLLKDEEDEEPYSPMDYEMEPGTIWRGNVLMPSIAEFHASAKYAAGANLSEVYPWQQLIGSPLSVEGRIQIDKASDYVCSLQWSKTTDVTVISLTPAEHAQDQAQFDKLFTYLTSRQRYGVGKSPVPNVRDIYIVPLEAGNAKKPDFIDLLEDCVLEDQRPSRVLLVVFIIKTTPPNGTTSGTASNATPRQPEINSPMTGLRGGSISSQASGHFHIPSTAQQVMSPLSAATPFPPPVSAQPSGQSLPGQMPAYALQQQHTPQTPLSAIGPKTGVEAARFVLGDLANSPTVAQILASAPNTPEDQWHHIRVILERDPKTRTDWTALMAALTARATTGS
jgi:hypothetical protein